MKLIEIFLPLFDNAGCKLPNSIFAATRRELIARFGGLTAYSRSPARGFWKDKGRVARDEIVVFEIMAKRAKRTFWSRYKRGLEKRFGQDEIVVRILDCHTV